MSNKSEEERVIRECIRNLDRDDEKRIMNRIDSVIVVSPETVMRVPLKVYVSGAKSLGISGNVTIMPYCLEDENGEELWFAEMKLAIGACCVVYVEDEYYLPQTQATFVCMNKFLINEEKELNDALDAPFE